jgi:carbamate kinase
MPPPPPDPRPAPPALAPDAPVVIALGGNALSPTGGRDSIDQQFEQTRGSAHLLADLVLSPAPIVITHGNGPQVGSAVRRSEIASHEVYAVPLSILVADLQGGMGYMISQCVNNAIHQRGGSVTVSTLITTVEVDAADPAFANPTKPIGSFYEPEHAAGLMAQGWQMVEIPGRGFRRVVPSPRPRAIVEAGLIRTIMGSGHTIVAVGGGGVPVVRDASGAVTARDAVIDKDLSSGLLALEIDAGQLLFATAVPRVALDFGTPQQRDLDHLSVADARRHLEAGQFPPGSMGPKIEAAVEFLEHTPRPDARVVISTLEDLGEALVGNAGTVIMAD